MRQSSKDLINELNSMAREREKKPTSAKSMRTLARRIKGGEASPSELKLAKKIVTDNQSAN